MVPASAPSAAGVSTRMARMRAAGATPCSPAGPAPPAASEAIAVPCSAVASLEPGAAPAGWSTRPASAACVSSMGPSRTAMVMPPPSPGRPEPTGRTASPSAVATDSATVAA